MILNYNKFGKQNKGSKPVVYARVGGANTTSFLAARQFHWHEIRRRRKARAGKNSFPPNPLPFCPPERSGFAREARNHSGFCSKNVRTSIKKHRQLGNKEPVKNVGSNFMKAKSGLFLKEIKKFVIIILQ